MSDQPLPEPLDAFLNHPPSAPPRSERRNELLRRTTVEIGRRRRRYVMRRWVHVAAAAALLIAVLAIARVMYLRESAETMPSEPRAEERETPRVPENTPSAPAPQKPRAADEVRQPAVAMEWKAFDAPRAEQSSLYLTAGNRYVEDERDLGSAVRCYGQAIHAAPTVEVDANDNWLVMALKMDEIERRREK
jgi:hypothetical protein